MTMPKALPGPVVRKSEDTMNECYVRYILYKMDDELMKYLLLGSPGIAFAMEIVL